jgi:hypothetical protein
MNIEPAHGKSQEATFNNAPDLSTVEHEPGKSPREILDPNRTLPQIELEEYEKYESSQLTKTRMRIVFNDQPIGRCTLQEYQGSVHFDGIELNDIVEGKQRGKGYGLATYLKAIEFAHERGLPFETQSSWNQTESAKKIWLLLRDAGVATEIEPFRPDTETHHPNRFKGRYRVEY